MPQHRPKRSHPGRQDLKDSTQGGRAPFKLGKVEPAPKAITQVGQLTWEARAWISAWPKPACMLGTGC